MSSSSYIKFYQEFLQKKSVYSNCEKEEGPPSPVSDVSASDRSKEENKTPEKDQLDSTDMEHSYTRDCRPLPVMNGLSATRTLLVRRPPQCPSCHTHPMDENSDMDDSNQRVIPIYNEATAKDAMNECSRIAKNVKNVNPDDQNWQERVAQNGWTAIQQKLFAKASNILDVDQLGRLANTGRQHEAIQRRVVIDKSAQRLRKALSAVSWEPRLTQWLHGLLMECLPPSYMASYLDILQTLKTKLPTLVDKMLFGRPMNTSQDLLAPVLKKQWEPIVMSQQKTRKLPQAAVIIALPSMPISGPVPNRIQKWYQHLATITQIVQVTLPAGNSTGKQPLENIAEQIVSMTRLKIQELRNEHPSRSIILVGFNAGASLALQVAMVESISSVICMGFSYNTLNGVRGTPDDRILDIKIPILFVIGQNSARSSQEEIESLREKMQSDTTMVIVGSADDVLRVPKSKRKIENVTQNMVDTMVIDEIYEFIKRMLLNPPGPRTPVITSSVATQQTNKKISVEIQIPQRKRKQIGAEGCQTPAKIKSNIKIHNASNQPPIHKLSRKFKTPQDPFRIKRKVGRPRTRPLPDIVNAPQSTPVKPQVLAQPTNDDLNLAIQSILGDGDTPTKTENTPREVTNYEIVTQPKAAHIKKILGAGLRSQPLSLGTNTGTKIKMIPSNQFVQLKPPMQSQTKIYTIKPTSIVSSSSTITPTVSGSQIFTIKPSLPGSSQAQIVSVGNQPKFTIVKTSPPKPTTVTSNNSSSSTTTTTTTDDLSNIFDMPIIFADNDGNLSETVSIPKAPASTPSPIIITPTSGTSSKGGTYVINTSVLQPSLQQQQKPNKVVFINRNTMKPCANIIARSTNISQMQKYTKVVVSNPKTAATIVNRPTQPLQHQLIKTSDKVIKQLNLHAIKPPTTVGAKTTSAPSILNLKKFHIVNVDPDKQKLIKTAHVSTTATNKDLTKNTIVINSGLKQVSTLLKPQILQRNVTVRKVVNLVPTAKTSGVITTTVSQLQSGVAVTPVATTIGGGSIVTSSTSPTAVRSNSTSPS